MTTLFTLDMNIPKLIQGSFGSLRQEKTDRILEPLQAMTQLALLSYCPIGTKLCVNNNILSLQLPTFSQGVWRWFNKDSKEYLYFLFNAVKRYYMWYRDEDNRDQWYVADADYQMVGDKEKWYTGPTPKVQSLDGKLYFTGEVEGVNWHKSSGTSAGRYTG